MNNTIKHIIWDFDGTLFDTYPGMVYAFKKALEDSGIEAEAEEIHEKMKVSVSNAISYYKELGTVKEDFIDKFTLYEKTLLIL